MTYEVMNLVWQCIDDRLKSGNLILGADIIVVYRKLKLEWGAESSVHMKYLCPNKIFELYTELSFGLITNASWKMHNSEVYYESASCEK